jgi:tetratricopeptide (TPR) repeat protein
MEKRVWKTGGSGTSPMVRGTGCKALLLFAVAVQLAAFYPSPLMAESEGPALTPAVQKAVYEAEQAISAKKYSDAERVLLAYNREHLGAPHYLVEFTLGNALSLQGKDRESLAHYRASTDLYPGFSAAWQNLGKVCFDLKEYAQAGDYMLKAYETEGRKDPTLRYHVAVSYMMGKEDRKALPHLEYLASGSAGSPKKEWLEALVKVCMDLRLEKKAIEAVQRVAEREENEPRWWKLLAQLHAQQGSYKQAVAAFEVHSYMVLAPEWEDVVLMGDLYNAIEVPAKAAECYEKALKLKQSQSVHEKLAVAYIASHKPDKALTVLEQAIEGEASPNLWLAMGRAFYEKGEYERGYEIFNRCSQMAPQDGRAYLMMGYCALQMQKKDAAVTALRKACQFQDHRRQAQELLDASASL